MTPTAPTARRPRLRGGWRRSLLLAVAMAATAVSPSVALAAPGDITTVAGVSVGYGGDGGPATAARLSEPRIVALAPGGGFLIADIRNERVRRVSASGVITTVAGTGTQGFGGDGGPATAALTNDPTSVAFTADGGYLIADQFNYRVRKVSPSGVITTVAGNGLVGSTGDGGPATSARINVPRDLAVTPDGGFLVADEQGNRIRKVSSSGIITTVAGTGTRSFSGDGGQATSATINQPVGVTVTPDDGFLIGDRGNSRIRKVSAGGIITTVAGTGVAGFSGDGGPATAAQLNLARGMAAAPDGVFYFADGANHRVRRVAADGVITTVAGIGAGLSGDGGPATAARLRGPRGVALAPNGGLYVADTDNHRVRYIEPGGTPPPPPPGDTTAPTVTTRTPAPEATDAPAAGNVVVGFSEAIAPASVGASSFSLAPASGGAALAGAITANAAGTQFTLDPSADLAAGTQYRLSLTDAITDVAGNPLAAESYLFTTAAPPPPPPPPPPGEPAYTEQGGLVVVEAENAFSNLARGGKSWSSVTSPEGFAGAGALQALPNTNATLNTGYATTAPQLRFRVNVASPGTFQVWMRARAAISDDNSAHVGLDGAPTTTADQIEMPTLGAYGWTRATRDGPVATLAIPTAGVHTIEFWMREDGLILDRLLLARSASYVPSGAGPAQSPTS